jgi:hypothetical protein
MSEKENLSCFIGSEGFVECDLFEITDKKNIKLEELKKITIGDVVDKIKNYYNNYYEINGRAPSKLDFNEFLNQLL